MRVKLIAMRMKCIKILPLVAIVSAIPILVGCAAPLQSSQKRDLKAYQAKSLEVKEKEPGVAAALGILPGGGSFYTREYGYGIVNLLFWPASVLWDPVNGYECAQSLNYYATKTDVEKKTKKETRVIEDLLEDGKLPKEKYLKQKREIEAKYSID